MISSSRPVADTIVKKTRSSLASVTATLLSAYVNSPINGSILTGLYYPHLPRLRGNILGRLSQVGSELGGEAIRAGELASKHPSGMCYEWIGHKIALLITKPEDIHKVLHGDGDTVSRSKVLKAFIHVFRKNMFSLPTEEKESAKLWAQKRKMYAGFLMRKQALDEDISEMQNIINEHIKHADEEIELGQFCTDLAMDIISRLKMGTSPLGRDSLTALQRELTNAMRQVTDYRNSIRLQMKELKIPVQLPTEESRHSLHNVIVEHIIVPNIKTILSTANLVKETAKVKENEPPPHSENKENVTKLSERVANQVRDLPPEDMKCTLGQALLTPDVLSDISFLLLAGHETTSKLIQFVLMELATYPHCVERIRQEYNEAKDGITTKSDLDQLTYLDKVIKEGLRLKPPVPVIAREVVKRFLLDEHTPLEKGTVILISPIVTQRLQSVAGLNPDQFQPDRWDKNVNPGLFASGAFIPFGEGMQRCIGEKFAIQEAKLAILTIVNNFNLTLNPKPGQTMGMLFQTRAEGTLKPVHPVHASLRRRY